MVAGPLIEIEITGAGSELQGVGRAPDGRAAFVPGALPGERVEAEIIREKPRFLEARLVRVLTSSPRRMRSACPHASACGGCAALHMDYEYSLELKRTKVQDALRRVGGFDADVRPVIGMADPFRTRNKAEYAISGGVIGLREAGGRRVAEVGDCLIQREESVEAMRVARAWLADAPEFEGYLVTRVTAAGEGMAILSADRAVDAAPLAERLLAQVPGMKSAYFCRLNARAAHALDGRCEWVRGERALTERLSGLTFRLSPQSFFQVNARGAEALYRAALDAAALTGRETVVDAYCGAGAIALYMARGALRTLGVELLSPAVEDARFNARANGLEDKAEFICDDAARWLAGQVERGLRPDVLCVDPPRRGLDERLIDAARRALPERIVYVSCDPATLARDLKRLCEGGPYAIEYVQPVDMFPWTSHVETVIMMTKCGSEGINRR
ncbi:23S rRNA (uracil(1939)-C(5))-methyltransferase RlmD [Bacillota bacterium Meth-B3]